MVSDMILLVTYRQNLQDVAIMFGLHLKKQTSMSFTIDTEEFKKCMTSIVIV